MKAAEITERIKKKEEQIKKINKRLDKWAQDRDSEKAFEKEYSWMNTFEDRKEYLRKNWQEKCDSEIKYAKRDLDEAEITLNKYKNMLALAEEKENAPVIQIFKDFFDKWKKEIKEYTEPRFKAYLEKDKECCDFHNRKYHYLETMTEEEYKEKYKKLHEEAKILLSDSWVSKMHDCKLYGTKTFDEFLDKYMEDRYYELIDKITKITGEITDVSRLYVGNDGSLNGEILGKLGKARIETIVAGGYNEGIIVNVKHGQCAHYRVLVHKIKNN